MQSPNKSIVNQIIPTPEENVLKLLLSIRKWCLQGRPKGVWWFLQVTNKTHVDFSDYDASLCVYYLYSSINFWTTKGSCCVLGTNKNLGDKRKKWKSYTKFYSSKIEEYTQVLQQKMPVVFSTTGISPLTLPEI